MRKPVRIWIALVALVAAASIPALHLWRDRMSHAGSWSDAGSEPTALDAAGVRHARFSSARPVAGEVNTPAEESRAAMSPDGRWLVFAAGARGSDAELWIAAVEGETTRDARPLTEIDTESDELAPAFADGALYFASDRPGGAGGLDLYRASFDDGRIGPAERLDATIQSAQDDTDPAPSRNGDEVVFASSRSGAFDLFAATPAPRGDANAWSVRRLDRLCSDAADREPAFDPEGRYLWFASQREGSFDLFRAACLADTFGPPERIDELSTAADERAPVPFAHGFEVLFARPADDGALDLWRAHSIELARIPSRPWSWLEIGTMLALLVAALLSFLANRWPALDTLYKCYLISLLLHLLLCVWLNRLLVDGGTPPGVPERNGIKVRLHPDTSTHTMSSSRVERGGDVSALASEPVVEPALIARAELGASLPRTSEAPDAIASEELRPAPSADPAAPERGDGGVPIVRSGELDTSALADREARTANGAGASPGLALEPRAFASESTSTPRGGPARARVDGGETVAARPSEGGRAIDVSRAVALDSPAVPRDGQGPPARSAGTPRGDALADREAHAAASAQPSPGLALEAPSFAIPPSSPGGGTAGGGPARAALSGSGTIHGDIGAGGPGTPGAARIGELSPKVALDAPSIPRASDGPPAPGGADRGIDALSDREARRVPGRDQGTGATSRSSGDDLLADLGRAAAPASAPSSGSEGPERAQLEGEREETRPSAPAPLALDAPIRTDAPPPPLPERSQWKGTPYENRTGTAKERALRDHGGSVETEQAVERGLDYLARIQAPGGNWGPLNVADDKYGRVCVGKTGLATLAFLGAGHTHVSGTKHSAVVAKALSFLLSVQDGDTGHFGDSDAYSHGIATYALAEAFALTQDADIRAALEPAIAHIVTHQSHDPDPRNFGGWSYFYAGDRVFDRWSRTSITAWQVMALESARLGGIAVEKRVFDDAARFLEAMRDEENGFYWYNQDPTRMRSGYPTLPASTPAGLFALSILGRDINADPYDAARAFVVDRSPRGFRFTGEDDFVERGQGNPYFWYYGTLAMFRAGGGAWATWNEAMKQTLLPAQASDGSWAPIDVYARYARDNERDKSYTTALSVLSLEVYYRYYLPLLKVR